MNRRRNYYYYCRLWVPFYFCFCAHPHQSDHLDPYSMPTHRHMHARLRHLLCPRQVHHIFLNMIAWAVLGRHIHSTKKNSNLTLWVCSPFLTENCIQKLNGAATKPSPGGSAKRKRRERARPSAQLSTPKHIHSILNKPTSSLKTKPPRHRAPHRRTLSRPTSHIQSTITKEKKSQQRSFTKASPPHPKTKPPRHSASHPRTLSRPTSHIQSTITKDKDTHSQQRSFTKACPPHSKRTTTRTHTHKHTHTQTHTHKHTHTHTHNQHTPQTTTKKKKKKNTGRRMGRMPLKYIYIYIYIVFNLWCAGASLSNIEQTRLLVYLIDICMCMRVQQRHRSKAKPLLGTSVNPRAPPPRPHSYAFVCSRDLPHVDARGNEHVNFFNGKAHIAVVAGYKGDMCVYVSVCVRACVCMCVCVCVCECLCVDTHLSDHWRF